MLSLSRKIAILILGIYWSVLFVLAHIQIPRAFQQAGISDKNLHFLAYLVLTLLFWSAIKFNQRVNWRKSAVWIVLFIIMLYGSVDEVVQSHIGRTFDAGDIAANMAGAVSGLLLLTFFSLWPSAMIITGITIFGVTNLTKANLAELFPFADVIFYVFAYLVFTALWIYNLRPKGLGLKPITAMTIVPFGLLLLIKIASDILGKSYTPLEMIVSAAAITAVIIFIYFIKLCRRPELSLTENRED